MTTASAIKRLNDWTGGLLVTIIVMGLGVAGHQVLMQAQLQTRMDGVERQVELVQAKLDDPSLSGFVTRRELELQSALLELKIQMRPPAEPSPSGMDFRMPLPGAPTE